MNGGFNTTEFDTVDDPESSKQTVDERADRHALLLNQLGLGCRRVSPG